MQKKECTDYLFASGCFRKAMTELDQADRSPRERLVLALRSVSHVVSEDLPRNAHWPFETMRNVIRAHSENFDSKTDGDPLPHAVNNMCDSEIEEVERATIIIAQFVEEGRQPNDSITLASTTI